MIFGLGQANSLRQGRNFIEPNSEKGGKELLIEGPGKEKFREVMYVKQYDYN